VKINSIDENKTEYVEVFTSIGNFADADSKIDEILKIIKKEITELSNYNYPSDHYNAVEILSNLGFDDLAVELLNQNDLNDPDI
jgi:hypothetical protein